MRWLALTAALAVATPVMAEGQATVPREQWGPDAALWVARSAVGEAGWHAEREWAAIAGVYLTRALERGHTVSRVARAYSAAIRPHRRHRRPWLFGLELDGQRPVGWPRGPSWERHRPRWLAAVEVVEGVLAGRVRSPCPEGTRHFGGHMDGEPEGHREVDCGETRNRFYSRVP